MDNWTDRLSEYIDGELTQDEAEQLEAHLLECLDCGHTLGQLQAVVGRAAQVIDRPPHADLWPAIAASIAEQKTIRTTPRRVSFSVPQLAAASVVLMLLSGGSMYLMLSRQADAPVVAATEQTQAPATSRQVAARAPVTTREVIERPAPVESPAADNYSVAITEMEQALAVSRTQLDTATVRIIESNLKAIDTAINEARLALARDPGNSYLNRYLDQTMQKKVQLLRRATGIIRAQT
jgi:anti-sigma factor RsiW